MLVMLNVGHGTTRQTLDLNVTASSTSGTLLCATHNSHTDGTDLDVAHLVLEADEGLVLRLH